MEARKCWIDAFILAVLGLMLAILQIGPEPIESPIQAMETLVTESNPTFWDPPRLPESFIPKSLESSIDCRGVPSGSRNTQNKTSIYRNLYWWKGQFFVFVVSSSILPYNIKKYTRDLKVDIDSHFADEGQVFLPEMKVFNTYEELATFVADENFDVWDQLTCIYAVKAKRFLHALWGGIYANFHALRRFGLQFMPFRSIVVDQPCTLWRHCFEAHDNLISEVLNAFGWMDVHRLSLDNFTAKKSSKKVRMLTVMAGTNELVSQKNGLWWDVSNPGGRELDATRLFRNRMFQSFGLPMNRQGEEQVLIVHWTGYAEKEKAMLQHISQFDRPAE